MNNKSISLKCMFEPEPHIIMPFIYVHFKVVLYCYVIGSSFRNVWVLFTVTSHMFRVGKLVISTCAILFMK